MHITGVVMGWRISLWKIWEYVFCEKVFVENLRFWRNPEKGVSCDPRGGGNVLRGLSNKCLMRGTFPAIFFSVWKHPFSCFFANRMPQHPYRRLAVSKKYQKKLWKKTPFFRVFSEKGKRQSFCFWPFFDVFRGPPQNPQFRGFSPKTAFFGHFKKPQTTFLQQHPSMFKNVVQSRWLFFQEL